MRGKVMELAKTMPVTDMHTHLYAPQFGERLLWGIDELLIKGGTSPCT